MKPQFAKKLTGINSAKDYSNNAFLIINNSGTEDSQDHKFVGHNEVDENALAEKTLDKDELMSNNPEDCKDTIFSGEGEILGTAGETTHLPYENNPVDKNRDSSNEELIMKLQKENYALKAYMKKILKTFTKFKHNHSITLDKNSIKIPTDNQS
jgi:hypothetical protein